MFVEKTDTLPSPTLKTVLNGHRQIPIHIQAQTQRHAQPTATRSTFHPFYSESLVACRSAPGSFCSARACLPFADTLFCWCCSENNHPQSALKSFSLENWIRTLNHLIYWKLLFVFISIDKLLGVHLSTKGSKGFSNENDNCDCCSIHLPFQ